jgi:competence protein ComEC
MRKKKSALMPALLSLLVFVGVRSHAIIKASLQQKIIVYNMPHSQAIDFINGRSYLFIGDDVVNSDKQMNHLYLQPCRSLFHVLPAKDHIQMQGANSVIHFANRIVLVEASSLKVSSQPLSVDILIMSNNSRIDFTSLIHDTHPKLIVADASNHTNKRNEWRKICNTLRIPFHDVTTDGALQYDLN